MDGDLEYFQRVLKELLYRDYINGRICLILGLDKSFIFSLKPLDHHLFCIKY